jgi:beta-phosphoglucomutase-like phosphatase (HAD superfamily)
MVPTMAAIRAVLLDWRGTLVVAPTYRGLIRSALGRIGRDVSDEAVDEVMAKLRRVDRAVASLIVV